jgi:hypothetical protein
MPTSTTIGPTETDTSTQTDGSDSSSTGEPDPGGCPAGRSCLAPPPAGWDGPLAIEETPAVDPASPCPDDYPAAGPIAQGGLQAADASCECTCGDPENTTCLPATLQRWDQGNDPGCSIPGNSAAGDCSGAPTHAFDIEPDGACAGPFNLGFGLTGSWNATLPNVTGGSCDPEVTSTVSPPTWDTRVTSCGGATIAGQCEDGGICAPNAGAPFSPALCIFRAGDQECPGGPYSDRLLRYQDFEDDRDCDGCTCGDPTGSCGGDLTLFGATGCGNELDIDPVAACSVHGCLVRAATWVAEPAASSCAPSTASATGGVEPSSPVTFCCLAG